MTQPEQVKLIDCDGDEIMPLFMPAREPGEPARTFIWQGRTFHESDGRPGHLYPRGWFIEEQPEAA